MAKKRYYSPYDTVNAWIANEQSELTFTGTTYQDWVRWREVFDRRLRELLGRTPKPVPLDPEVLERVDCGDHIREKVVFDTEQYASVPAYVLLPKDLALRAPPGILAAHGHGRQGRHLRRCRHGSEYERIEPLNYDYARQFVRRGYGGGGAGLARLWRAPEPGGVGRVGRDPCNVNYLAEGYRGYHLLALQIWDGRRTVDYPQSRPEVDPERLKCAVVRRHDDHLPGGPGAAPRRWPASAVPEHRSGRRDGMRGLGNFCGAPVHAGTAYHRRHPRGGRPDRPEAAGGGDGQQDTCFIIEDMKRAYAQLSDSCRRWRRRPPRGRRSPRRPRLERPRCLPGFDRVWAWSAKGSLASRQGSSGRTAVPRGAHFHPAAAGSPPHGGREMAQGELSLPMSGDAPAHREVALSLDDARAGLMLWSCRRGARCWSRSGCATALTAAASSSSGRALRAGRRAPVLSR